MSKRLKAKQKDFDLVKRKTEAILVEAGGWYEDKRSGNAVVSKYHYEDACLNFKWHGTYSHKNSLTKVEADTKRLLHRIGVNRKNSKDQIMYRDKNSMH